MRTALEIIGFNIQSCITAQQCGADRIELCASPAEGGITPPYSQIVQARKVLQIPFFVMIRPRGGDFLFSDMEFQMMLWDIKVCRNAGADGIVTGVLTENGYVDVDRCSRLVEAAYPMGVTFHRAFDRVRDYKRSIRDVINTGCERILTSGLHPSCMEGLEILKDLVSLASGDISIMPGSGVRSSNIRQIVASTGATEIHSSASVKVDSQMKFVNDQIKESLQHVEASGEEIEKMIHQLSDRGTNSKHQ